MDNNFKEEKDRGFLLFAREDPAHRPVAERVKDYSAVELPPEEDMIRRQAARCMDCGVPFCHSASSGCPLGNIMPEFNEAAHAGRWREALEVLLSTNCFPEFTGRVCPAPCESACVLGINDDPVAIRPIELEIIEKAWQCGYMKPHPPKERKKEKVAVLGSGPAGLACAEVLNRCGWRVTVYETDVGPGGILRYGIPDFKLEKWVIDRRIDLMKAEGVVFECAVKGGEDVSGRYLKGRFDAIVIAGGARRPRDLDVPGRDLEGIHMAMDYLTAQNKRIAGEPIGDCDITAADKRVVVIGGGDTGSDCIGTALRQGAGSVTQIEILPKPPERRTPERPWPLWPGTLRVSSSHKEGARRRWSVSTKAFKGDSHGRVKALECVEVEWEKTEAGPRISEKPGSRHTTEADLVLLAMGFTGPGENTLVEDLDIKRDAQGFIARDENFMTNHPGLFVSGDMWRGASLVVHAIADGVRCAEKVDDYLEKTNSFSRLRLKKN